MILIVGGTRGAGKVAAEYLDEQGHEVVAVGKKEILPATVPQGLVFYQRDRENEFQAGVEVSATVLGFYVARGMKDASVVLIGSTSIHEDDGSSSDYRLTKTAMLSLAKAWAKQYRDRGIMVNMVSPGDFRSGPMTAWDVARAVAFLLACPFVTGQEIVVRA